MKKKMEKKKEAQKEEMKQKKEEQQEAQRNEMKAQMEEQQAEKENEMQAMKDEMEEKQAEQADMLLKLSEGLATMGGNLEERSEEHTSELQSRGHLVCRLLLEKKNKKQTDHSWKKK